MADARSHPGEVRHVLRLGIKSWSAAMGPRRPIPSQACGFLLHKRKNNGDGAVPLLGIFLEDRFPQIPEETSLVGVHPTALGSVEA